MEKDKAAYLEALKKNNGKLDERAVGENLGFSKAYTDEIIQALLSEEKIEYSTDPVCNYKVKES